MMNYNLFARKILMPLIDYATGYSIANQVKFFNKYQWFTAKHLQLYQLYKIKKLIHHSFNTVPFYMEYSSRNNLRISDFNELEDLKKLPIIDKKTIQKNPSSFISNKYSKKHLIQISSGGTTGKPFKSFTTKYGRSVLHSVSLRGKEWGQYNYGDKIITLAGSSLIPNNKLSLSRKLKNLFDRNYPLSATHVNDSILLSYCNEISRFNPKIIRGYPSSLYVLANFVKKNKIKDISPTSIFTTAEVLIDKHRKYISDVFNCKVYNHYSNPESLANAYECEHGSLHLGVEASFVEVLTENNSVGKLIATDLYNYGMPMIRYDTEDLAEISKSPCKCGRHLPVIKSLQGRSTDIITFSNGNTIAGPALTLIFQNFNIENYQIIQKSKDSLLIKIVESKNFQVSEKKEMYDIMKYHCGVNVKIEISSLPNISVSNRRKWNFIISENDK